MRKWFLTLLMAGIFFFGGCGEAEVENREFPVILSVSEEIDNFPRAWLEHLYSGNKKLDYNHLKVVVIEQEFLEEEEKMQEMLTILAQDKNVPLNAYVVVTSDISALERSAENLDRPLGNYLEELLEHMDEVKKETFPTLGMLYQEEKNKLETLFIPYVLVLGNEPEIYAYEAYAYGKALGVVDTDTALLSFFINNQMKEYELQLEEKQFVKFSNTKNEITFAEVQGQDSLQKQVQVHICCDAEILYQNISENRSEVQIMLENEMKDYMDEKTKSMLDEGLDLTNSRKKLGGSMRSWYGGYMDPDDDYEDDIEIVFDVDMNWIE